VAIARGYLNRPELTAEKFIEWAVATEHGQRLYRTGDLVRWRADGTLEYLGRVDEQVKLRGFRIELGEIEAALREHPAVRDAVVAAREDVAGDTRLVAYLINENGIAPKAQELKNHLRQKLPEYMVPLHYLSLDKFPLSPSGKVDRKRLPAPDGARPDSDTPYVEPRTNTEKQIALVWSELLGVARVGIHDNFFELGGHSLLATRMVVRLREAMQIELPLRTLFEFPTLAAFAEAVERAGRAAQAPAIVPLAREARRLSRSSLQKNQLVTSSETTGDQPSGLRS
jgi:acyl carrier protein